MREIIPSSTTQAENDKAADLYFHHYLGNRPTVINIYPSRHRSE